MCGDSTGLAHLEALQGKNRPSVMRIAVKCPGHGRGDRGEGEQMEEGYVWLDSQGEN